MSQSITVQKTASDHMATRLNHQWPCNRGNIHWFHVEHGEIR